jgi:6,7-dimethyl-8-ribityllumazine synthase
MTERRQAVLRLMDPAQDDELNRFPANRLYTQEAMIKGITLVRKSASSEDHDRVTAFLATLGFEPGQGWSDSASRGASFLAPLGNLEFVDGILPIENADLYIEVTALDDLHRQITAWFLTNKGNAGEITPTHWKSRLFVAEPVPGTRIAFWEWNEACAGKPAAIAGDLLATGMKFAIVVSRWNAVITQRLLQGALDALLRSGASRENIAVVHVPGAWEIPSAARTLAEAKQADAIITLGCLIRGETAHYEAIYTEVARGIGQSQQETGIPHAFGVLTCETLEQALDRAGLKAGNKGFEAAVAAIEMVSLTRKLAPAQTRETQTAAAR